MNEFKKYIHLIRTPLDAVLLLLGLDVVLVREWVRVGMVERGPGGGGGRDRRPLLPRRNQPAIEMYLENYTVILILGRPRFVLKFPFQRGEGEQR